MSTESINILLVDDLEENLIALEALLQREGLTFLKARTGEEALELLLVHEIALALLDVQMPGMDGFQLAEFMRGSERSRHVPIIFLTAGTADAQRRFRGYEAGAVDFLQKPIEKDILRSKTNVFFELYAQRRKIVAQRDELEALASQLRAADRRKGDFIATLGHELRNPIMALGSGLRLLERGAAPERAEQIRHNMTRQVGHMARLVEDLLDIARIDQGKISLTQEHIVLQDALAFAIESSEPRIEAGQHTLTVEMPADPVTIYADHARIAQIVSNLLNNAAKYSPPGAAIGLTLRVAGGLAEIEISDTGIGIPTEMQTRIFDLFTQVEPSSSSPDPGLGIGLALVRQLVELHGGGIVLKSSVPGEGSTFLLQLPLVADLQSFASSDDAGKQVPA
jgi:signal transduction histidine kinase